MLSNVLIWMVTLLRSQSRPLASHTRWEQDHVTTHLSLWVIQTVNRSSLSSCKAARAHCTVIDASRGCSADSAADRDAAQYSSNGDTPFGDVTSLIALQQTKANLYYTQARKQKLPPSDSDAVLYVSECLIVNIWVVKLVFTCYCVFSLFVFNLHRLLKYSTALPQF